MLGFYPHDPLVLALGVVLGGLVGFLAYRRRVVTRSPVVLFVPSGDRIRHVDPFSIEIREAGAAPEIVRGLERLKVTPLEDLAAHGTAQDGPDWGAWLEEAGLEREDRAEVWTRANGHRELRVLEGDRWRLRSRLPSLGGTS